MPKPFPFITSEPTLHLSPRCFWHVRQGAKPTPDPALKHWEEVCGAPAEELGADRGYHSSESSEEVKRISKVAIPTKGKKPHPDKKKPYFRRLQRTRAGIEPVIGHLKSDHRMDCSRYKGFEGDKMNVSWAALAWNTKKWARSAKKGVN